MGGLFARPINRPTITPANPFDTLDAPLTPYRLYFGLSNKTEDDAGGIHFCDISVVIKTDGFFGLEIDLPANPGPHFGVATADISPASEDAGKPWLLGKLEGEDGADAQIVLGGIPTGTDLGNSQNLLATTGIDGNRDEHNLVKGPAELDDIRIFDRTLETDEFNALSTIRCYEPITPQVSMFSSTTNIAEGDDGDISIGNFNIYLSEAILTNVTANWVVEAIPGSQYLAPSGSDFVGGVLPSGAATILAGDTQVIVAISIAGDYLVEDDEKFRVRITSVSSNAILDTANDSRNGTIFDNDVGNVVSIAAQQLNILEGTGNTTLVEYAVTRTGDLNRGDVVAWEVQIPAVTGANDMDASDFPGGSAPSGFIEFLSGEATQIIQVPIQADAIPENTENLIVSLQLTAQSEFLQIGTGTATTQILDDDVAGDSYTIFGASATKVEGDSGQTDFTFTVARAGSVLAASVVSYSVAAITADAADFVGGVLPSGTINFGTGATSVTLTIAVQGDLDVEFTETFAVQISNPTDGGQINVGIATGVITTDDFSVSATDALSGARSKTETSGNVMNCFGTPIPQMTPHFSWNMQDRTVVTKRSPTVLDDSFPVTTKWYVILAGSSYEEYTCLANVTSNAVWRLTASSAFDATAQSGAPVLPDLGESYIELPAGEPIIAGQYAAIVAGQVFIATNDDTSKSAEGYAGTTATVIGQVVRIYLGGANTLDPAATTNSGRFLGGRTSSHTIVDMEILGGLSLRDDAELRWIWRGVSCCETLYNTVAYGI